MTRHVSNEKLARFQDGQLRPVTARRVEAHLAACARCRESSAALAGIPPLLAAAEVPPMPAHLAARIETALTTESAHRAAGAPSLRSARHDRARLPDRLPRPAARPSLAVLSVAAAAVVIGGGGYELVSQLGSPPAATTSGSSSGGSSAASSPRRLAPEAGRSPVAHAVVPGAAGRVVYGPPVNYQRGGSTGTFRPVRTATNYQPAQLAGQVTATLAQLPAGAAPSTSFPGASASGGARHATASPGTSGGFQAGRLGQLAGCVSRVAAGQAVLLVDVARFRGAPATVIVTAGRGQVRSQIWVAGPGCSRSASDVLTHQQLPGR
jgi:anti-sigma factor RsiW